MKMEIRTYLLIFGIAFLSVGIIKLIFGIIHFVKGQGDYDVERSAFGTRNIKKGLVFLRVSLVCALVWIVILIVN